MPAVYTADNIKKYLQESNRDIYGRRTWSEAFGNINLNAQKALEKLSVDYGQQFGEAYATTKANESLISSSALGQGYKSAAIAENEAALEAAYDAYLKNYISDISTIEAGESEQLALVNKELTNQAQNTSDYINSQFGYLETLLQKYSTGEISGDIFKRFDYAPYFDVSTDETGNIITDENGNPVMVPKSIDAIKSEFFDPITGEMTAGGWRFFQQVAGDQELRQIYSFDTYLQENDPELYEWASSFNPYDANTNAAGQNLNFVGANNLLKVDEVYTAAERLIGADVGAIAKEFNKVNSILNDLHTAMNDENADEIVANREKFSAEMGRLVEDFGLSEYFVETLNEQGYNVKNVEDAINQITAEYEAKEGTLEIKEDESALGGGVAGGIIGGAGGFLAGAALFAMASNPVGWVVGGLTLLGSAVGAGVGAAVGSTESASGTEQAHAQNQKDMEQRYAALVAGLVDMTQRKISEAEQSFYGDVVKHGGTITNYDSNIATSFNGNAYEYAIDGTTATYLSSARLNSTVEDEDGDNFEIEWDGETYDLEIMDDSAMDSKTQEKLARYVYKSTGKALKPGDTFYYNHKLWVVTGEDSAGRIRQVQNQFWDNDFNNLMRKLNPEWESVSTWN